MAIQDKYTVVESPDFNLPAVLERKRDLLKSHDNGWLYGQLNRLNSFYIST
jgi:ERCC4-type nuclease